MVVKYAKLLLLLLIILTLLWLLYLLWLSSDSDEMKRKVNLDSSNTLRSITENSSSFPENSHQQHIETEADGFKQVSGISSIHHMFDPFVSSQVASSQITIFQYYSRQTDIQTTMKTIYTRSGHSKYRELMIGSISVIGLNPFDW